MATIYKLAPYLLMAGMICLTADGLWVADHYDWIRPAFPKQTWNFLAIGVLLVLIAHFIIRLHETNGVRAENHGLKTDNRQYFNKLWEKRERVGNQLCVIVLILLGCSFLVDILFMVFIAKLLVLLGIVGIAFVYMAHDDHMPEHEYAYGKSTRIRRILKWLDYRKHPFSISFFLYLFIVIAILLQKPLDYELDLQSNGSSRYPTDVPFDMYALAGFLFACTFLYIFHHCDFFGIRPKKQSDDKLLFIHFAEMMICGIIFFIFIFLLFEALLQE